MGKVLYGPEIEAIVGSVGGTTFQMINGIPSVRAKPCTSPSYTVRRQYNQQLFKLATQLWPVLPLEVKQSYSAYRLLHRGKTNCGSLTISARGIFVRRQMGLVWSGNAMDLQSVPTTYYSDAFPDIEIFEQQTPGIYSIDADWGVLEEHGFTPIFWLTAYQSPGRTVARGYRLVPSWDAGYYTYYLNAQDTWFGYPMPAGDQLIGVGLAFVSLNGADYIPRQNNSLFVTPW